MSVQEIPLNKIALQKNSRLNIKDSDLSELMASIKSVGLLQPIGVVKHGVGFRVCYGNRRFLAASKLGYSKIAAIVHDHKKPYESDLKNLTENLQRRNISLAETGRYIELLEKEGLKTKEVAVRLGVAESYVKACLSAFRAVPAKYRDDLEVRVSARKPAPGKIMMTTAQAIISAQKSYSLGRTEVEELFKSAKSDPKFSAENVNKYAVALKSGEKNFTKTVSPVKHVAAQFLIDEDEYERLYAKYIADGPCRSMNALFITILSGERVEKVRMAKTN